MWRREHRERARESQDDENDVEVDGEMVFEEDLEEALPPAVVRDPGTSTEKEIAEHSVTHLPHRSWCPIYVCRAEREIDHTDVLTEANTLYQNCISITCSWDSRRK